MKRRLCERLFDFDLNNHNLYVSNNSIYMEVILYIFSHTKKDLLLVYPTLNEATVAFNSLKNYDDSVYIFPEDDFITKSAIAISPDLLFLRLKILNSLLNKDKKIVITHYNSFVKKLPNREDFVKNEIVLKKNSNINRDNLIKKLYNIGYKKESLVMNTSEFAIRGFVMDIFPIHEENPVRIEFFDDAIESIKYFDETTQKTIDSKCIDSITINAIKDDFGNNKTSIIDFFDNILTIYINYNELIKIEKMNIPQIKYLDIQNEIFKVKDLIKETDIYINTIDNNKKYDLVIEAKSIEYYNNNKNEFINDIIKNNGTLYSINDKTITSLKAKNIKIENEYLENGFIYNNNYYYSDNDLFKFTKAPKLISDYKYGNKIDSLDKLKIGDYVVHRKSGIGIYMGLKTIEKNGLKKDYILIQYKGSDKLYLPVEDIEKLYKYTSKEGAKPIIHKLNSVEWTKTKLKIKNRLKDITGELLKIYKERNKATIEPFSKDDENQLIFESEFQYDVTVDQYKSSEEIKRDLEKRSPMERLLCGDVGYGKTEVIFRAIFKTVMNGKQVAYLCPTTILSYQQYNSALDRFKNYGVNIALINRDFTNKDVQNKLNKLKEGKIDVIFGTHRLLSKDVIFKDLGLLVIDEEHRFGVEQKEKIKSMKSNVHVLSVSATPIPRSLQMSLVGIRDMSLIESAPKNRYPVQTYVIEYNEMLLRESVINEMSRGGQCFILYNNIFNMEKELIKLNKLIPEARIGYAHGKMSKNEMQERVYEFTNYKYDVLLSTTIIENGIDIPNANTIIVLDADRFGLSQLYQIRGRVGRSNRIAYAYLMYRKERVLTSTAVKRLEAIKEFTELGSGYKISMRDLAIRGAGDILGSEQAGFIDSIGVDMYLDLINEEVKGINIDDEDDNKTIIPIDVETHIDENVTDENSIIISLHKKINGITTKKELIDVMDEIKDRFGRTNEQLEIYAYEKYLEKLLLVSNVLVLKNNDIKIVFKLNEKSYSNINVEKLFVDSMKISIKFNFEYLNKSILITLLKATLDENYIFYSVRLLELINNLKK